MDLAQKKCVACEGGAQPMTPMEAEAMLTHVKDWSLASDTKTMTKQFTFKNFKDAMEFANKIGDIAEAEGHHPDLSIGWGRVAVVLSTHAIGGLSENDFILAAKIDKIV
ncbi:4a-hydroxytetrahydrobiopterin dehydratase [Candidatus Kaiserbacteria bacterium CG10_big_fil_rev_8_21_14_0_10_49_17]|uniref:Putative pterin-4-alpha-carbinolamine dehydratase n=1 Tax=Candidatus Kaiserbacteria bacterium CG10_big_fil_rev_8_21_14_0_10_49_17 TaxID=1974609 RepID=A0A2M6WEC3_9BACT|nr:MAG: 4a-hydroxytetrahydrobiopterin dehydratase [Candidatus Kaiserbacteria bacterium CG10_big_fil_rev_8_21_14_0_10_49_17]